jgi:hypothetical protein
MCGLVEMVLVGSPKKSLMTSSIDGGHVDVLTWNGASCLGGCETHDVSVDHDHDRDYDRIDVYCYFFHYCCCRDDDGGDDDDCCRRDSYCLIRARLDEANSEV